jgi:hypothetical protein
MPSAISWMLVPDWEFVIMRSPLDEMCNEGLPSLHILVMQCFRSPAALSATVQEPSPPSMTADLAQRIATPTAEADARRSCVAVSRQRIRCTGCGTCERAGAPTCVQDVC